MKWTTTETTTTKTSGHFKADITAKADSWSVVIADNDSGDASGFSAEGEADGLVDAQEAAEVFADQLLKYAVKYG